jgi:hypothetical protein
MTTLQAGDRVVTNATLDNEGWHPKAAERRRAGVRGVVKKWEPEITGNRGKLLKVLHDDMREAEYYAHELNPIRERAVEAAISSPEQVALDKLEAKVEQLGDAIAVDLAGIDARMDRIVDRLGGTRRPPRSVMQALRGLHREGHRWRAWRLSEAGGIAFAGDVCGAESRLLGALETLDELGVQIGQQPEPEPEPDEIPEVAWVRERIADMMGQAVGDEPLAATLARLGPRVGVVRDLLETIPIEGLRGVAQGLELFTDDEQCPGAVVSAALFELANVEDPPGPKRSPR